MTGFRLLLGRSLIFAAIASTAVAAAPPTKPTLENQGQGNRQEIKDYCLFLLGTGYYDFWNLGECMSYSSVSDQGFRTKYCDFLRETGQLDDEGFSSFADCVSTLSQH